MASPPGALKMRPGAASLFSDLPRTMARIRRLVREHPNDRELQRLLHTLLTSMSSDRLNEEAVYAVLSKMEARCAAQSEGNCAFSTPVTSAPHMSSPPRSAPASRFRSSELPLPARLPSPAAHSPPPATASRPYLSPRDVGLADAFSATGEGDEEVEEEGPQVRRERDREEEEGARVGGASFETQVEGMRKRHEQALSTLRQKALREARQAQAHHEVGMAQLRRQCEAQLATVAEAHRAEEQRVEALRVELTEANAKLRRMEQPATSLSVEELQHEYAAEISAMARSHKAELAARERATQALLERESAGRERTLAEMEARFAEEKSDLERSVTRLELRAKETDAVHQHALELAKARAERAEEELNSERGERRREASEFDLSPA